uniref:TnpV protein n=1 Tax=Carnobacterium maltaromaticum TaxID=2751 RepID=UPI00398363E9
MALEWLETANQGEYLLLLIGNQLMNYGSYQENEAWELHNLLEKELLEKEPVLNTMSWMERTRHLNKIKMIVEEQVISQLFP